MSSRNGKKYKDAREKVDRDKFYPLDEALTMLKELSFTTFDESVDVAVRLGVNPRHADQMVRGSVLLPHGTGKETRVLVFAKGEKEKEATDAGADFVGSEELIDKISKGWLEFDKAIATPDMMGMVGKIGKLLGPRGMMPNPKVGTVTFNISDAVSDLKKGKIEFKVDKAGIIKGSAEPNRDKVGKVTPEQVKEIAELKMPDLNAVDIEGAMQIIAGTARSMGIEVV